VLELVTLASFLSSFILCQGWRTLARVSEVASEIFLARGIHCCQFLSRPTLLFYEE
jgi:hypothetical protein